MAQMSNEKLRKVVAQHTKKKELENKNKEQDTGNPHSQTYSNDPDRKRDNPRKYQDE